MSEASAYDVFVAETTDIVAPPLVPELHLHLASDPRTIFVDAHERWPDGHRPYWAFAWPGGQGLSRYILDNRELVADRRIVDVGSGSAMAGIAARLAGARHVLAADIDPLAAAAARLNAALNDVAVETTTDDLLGAEADADLVIIGDLVYEPDLKDRVGAFIARHVARGIPMLYGDRTTARRPPGRFRLLAEYDAPLTPPQVDNFPERARVWMLHADEGRSGFD